MTPLITMPGPLGFLGLKEEEAVPFEKAKAVIIPFGLEASVSYGGGASKGPQAMIQASHQVELFDESLWSEPVQKIGIVTLEEPSISKSLPQALDQLETLVEGVLAAGKFPLVFGGEHAITAGAIRPFAKHYEKLTLLQFDAHADLRDGYQGEHYSHAAAMRRCLDFPNVTLISCGIRSLSQTEVGFWEANQGRIHTYWAKDKRVWNINEICSHLKDMHVYITFDIDAFDISLMPATGTPEPGGLFWHEAIDILAAVSQCATIVGADVNELAPIRGMHAYDFLAAKLAYKVLTYALLKK